MIAFFKSILNLFCVSIPNFYCISTLNLCIFSNLIITVPIAAPITYTAPITTITTPVVAQINEKTQYQAKNSAGEISYGHTEENQAHNAVQVNMIILYKSIIN